MKVELVWGESAVKSKSLGKLTEGEIDFRELMFESQTLPCSVLGALVKSLSTVVTSTLFA